jgi:hypothetical protein
MENMENRHLVPIFGVFFLLTTRLFLHQHDFSLSGRITDNRQQPPAHQSCGDDDFFAMVPEDSRYALTP